MPEGDDVVTGTPHRPLEVPDLDALDTVAPDGDLRTLESLEAELGVLGGELARIDAGRESSPTAPPGPTG